MGSDWVVDRIVAEDWATLRDMRLRGLMTDPDSFGSTWEDEQDGDEQWWRAWVSGSAWFVVASETGGPLGIVVGVSPDAPGGDYLLNGMWVAPEARGRGIAAALALSVIGWVRGEGGERIELTVVDGNEAARGLFERLGFQATGERYPRERDPSRWNERLALSVRLGT